jgi:hypothetical protein
MTADGHDHGGPALPVAAPPAPPAFAPEPGTATAMVPSLRTLAPQLLTAGILPVIGYSLLRPHVGNDATALAAVMVFPAGDIAYQRWRRGTIEPIGIIALCGIALGLVSALVFHGNAMLLKIRESVFTGVFGLACLASLLRPRPVMFYLGRLFATGNDPKKMAEFEGVWELPDSPRRFRFVTVVWGVALAAEAVVRTALAVVLSTQRFLEVVPVVGWAVLGGLLFFTTRYTRSAESAALAELAELAELEAG